jgi:hypothetical protein
MIHFRAELNIYFVALGRRGLLLRTLKRSRSLLRLLECPNRIIPFLGNGILVTESDVFQLFLNDFYNCVRILASFLLICNFQSSLVLDSFENLM